MAVERKLLLQTAFADARIEKGLEPLRNVSITGPDGFFATFRDTPKNREFARLLIEAFAAFEAPASELMGAAE